MKINKIYFDMDGVLADFAGGVRKYCHMEPVDQGDNNNPNEDAMWEGVKAAGHFYDMLDPLPGAKELFDMLYEKYGDRCEILTGMPGARRGIKTAAEDKTNWAHRNFHPDIKVNVVMRRDKIHFCHGPEDILIDDFTTNISDWESYGGTGVYYPDFASAIKKLKELGII